MIHRVTNMFVGDGSALPANNALVAPANITRLGIFGTDSQALDPAGNDTISTAGGDAIDFWQKLADGSLKHSMRINGQNVVKAKAIHYRPSRRNVWGIGYNRGFRTAATIDGPRASFAYTAATGSITVANSTDYHFMIRFKNDKTFYSERPEVLDVVFTSAAAATQLSIATQIAGAINGSAFGNQTSGISEIQAIVVGDGTGVYGVTGATNYGVEIWALTVNQFTSSTYKENRVFFSVHVDDNTGFGSGTACVELQTNAYGEGTYNFVSNMENYLAQYEGVSNRRLWPAQTVTLTSSATPVTSGDTIAAATNPLGALTAAAASTNTVGQDLVAVTTSTAGLNGGDLIVLNTTTYEIKYVRSATTFVLTTPLTQVVAASTAKMKYFYDLIVLEFNDTSFTSGADVKSEARKSVIIATPAIDAAAADPFDSTGDAADTSAEGLDLLDILNKWLGSTPLAPATLTYAYIS